MKLYVLTHIESFVFLLQMDHKWKKLLMIAFICYNTKWLKYPHYILLMALIWVLNCLQVREISNYFAPEVTRWQAEALQALQEVSYDFLFH